MHKHNLLSSRRDLLGYLVIFSHTPTDIYPLKHLGDKYRTAGKGHYRLFTAE